MTGFINVNKEEGVSSAREVAVIKRLSGSPCGHMGTLDPMASGVLPVAIGNAARLFDYFLNKRKKYVATFEFGINTDTLDTTGEITERGKRIPSEDEIAAALPEFIGKISQIPPKFSAKNVNGKRGYQLAREGVNFSIPPKEVEVFSFEILNYAGSSCRFCIECGGGTYIRSLARDLGANLGSCAVMSELIRTQSGIFKIENSVKTSALNEENLTEYLVKTDSVLDFESFYPNATESKKLFNGLSAECKLKDGTYKIYDTFGGFYGLAEARSGYIKVRTKLC